MRTEHPFADRCAESLAMLPLSSAIVEMGRLADSPWLELAVRSGAAPEDLGVFWVVLDDDAMIWPVRVYRFAVAGERHAVWLTYETERGSAFMVITQPTDAVTWEQAGDQGRTRLLSRSDESGSWSSASDESPSRGTRL